ncbi:MAG TPA: glycosyltransferase [Candidatus Deferrimicrobiaceae bacterium]|nr:glycosyltransferase [Candidatus Deferrimicrobiaceae bacterium]
MAFVSSYPPRTSGVAAFTDHLARITPDREVVALDPPGERPAYPIEVHHRIRVDERSEFARVAQSVSACVDVVALQHDRGLWGVEDGEAVLDFLGGLDVPAVTTLHDIPNDPSPRERAILLAVIQGSAATVAMSDAGRRRLAERFDVAPDVVDVIHHGAPDLPPTSPEATDDAAERLGVAGLEVILGFGLLGPEKGCELTIEAMPEILAARPAACHIVVGAIHPDEIRRRGSTLRDELIERAEALGVADRVRFVDRFVGRSELTHWLQAANVIVMPQRSPDRVSSGSLAYALGAGRPVVAAPSLIATELLGDGAGVVLAKRSPGALATAIIDLLGDPARSRDVGGAAYERGRTMTWSKIGPMYQALFDRIAAPALTAPRRRGSMPPRPYRVRAR